MFSYAINPIDFFAYALTVDDYEKVIAGRSTTDLRENDRFNAGSFRALVASAKTELDRINTDKDWVSPMYVTPFPNPDQGDIALIFWRKGSNNGTIFVTSEIDFKDYFGSREVRAHVPPRAEAGATTTAPKGH